MRRAFCPWLHIPALTASLMAVVFARSAFAYVDPGTYQAVWTSLAPLVGLLVGCFALLLVPFWFLFRRARALWARRPKGTKALALVAAVAVLAAAVGGTGLVLFGKRHEAGTSAGQAKAGGYERVLVLGMDGLDPTILERMMDAGQLPNFAKLRREGSYARLQTSVPPESPVAWTCAATGMNPARHGIYDFVQRDLETYLPVLSTPRPRNGAVAWISGQPFAPAITVKTFWDLASDHGKKVAVIRWPVTFPAQRVNGHLLTGLGTPDVAGTPGHYYFFTTHPAGEKPGPRVVGVNWEDGAISTRLPGPVVQTVTGRAIRSIPLRIKRNGADAVLIQLGKDEPFKLRVGDWSAWRPVQFPGGVSSSCPAIVKLYLTSLSPDLDLFVTPPHIDPMKPAYPISYPDDYANDLARQIGYYATLGLAEDPDSVLYGCLPLSAYLQLCNDITREREAMFERELRQFKSGLLAVVFDTSDRVQHIFWAATDPLHPMYTPELARQFGHAIEDHYKRMDVVLGRAMQAVRGDVGLILMSDHGFTSVRRAANLNTWLVGKGYLVPKDPNAPADPRTGNVDWSKTRAYAMGYCGLYLNVRGRDPEGIVEPPEEYRRVRDEIAQALCDWRDPATGAHVARSICTKEEVYQGDHFNEAPDLIVGYAPGYRASAATVVGTAPPEAEIVDNKTLWSGDHVNDAACVPGIFLSNFKCKIQNPRLIDIAPTVLRLLDVPASSEMDGHSLW